PEWVVKITGQVNKRPDKLINKDLDTGEYEILAEEMEILNESKTPPFELGTDGYEVNEEIRMKNRYLDVRRERLQKNIRNRSKMITFATNFLQDKDFVQVETPVLSKSTPEGARDYLVPSRVQPGKFYALPQSPQQYKQLLMTSGIERYFQFARCFRDEDTRGDRQPEFTQLDMEMSFVEEEDVMGVVEEMLIKMIGELYPEKKIQTVPFPRMTYKEAMDKYGTDRPDLRENKDDPNLLAFCWVVDFPFFEKTDDGKWTFTHNPFSAPKPEYMKMLMDGENIGEILTTQYDISLNGWEIAGGSIRNHQSEALRKVFEVMGLEEEKVQENFGHMLEAFNNGTPPHGGIAYGFDRLVMILQNEPNIREVIAFPKTGDGRDLMMEAPSEAGKDQLKELSIEINPVRDKKSDGK
ncbi:aspartate--tRNA ligase, partial [Candidatus Wolfebacteria bacterium]|nr:aspartate--tRNA ligase [Candidatus Wolfebacteria bacterium]